MNDNFEMADILIEKETLIVNEMTETNDQNTIFELEHEYEDVFDKICQIKLTPEQEQLHIKAATKYHELTGMGYDGDY